MNEYRRRVENLARARNGEPIANGSYDHAAVIVEQMFKNAKQQVSILTGNLNARVYGREEVLEEAKLFLAHSSHSARILLEEQDDGAFSDHPFFEELGGNTNLEIRYVPADIKQLYDYHFLAMDCDSYRFEPKKDEPVAVAAFGDESGAKNLLKIFDAMWEVGEKVELPSVVTQEHVSVTITT